MHQSIPCTLCPDSILSCNRLEPLLGRRRRSSINPTFNNVPPEQHTAALSSNFSALPGGGGGGALTIIRGETNGPKARLLGRQRTFSLLPLLLLLPHEAAAAAAVAVCRQIQGQAKGQDRSRFRVITRLLQTCAIDRPTDRLSILANMEHISQQGGRALTNPVSGARVGRLDRGGWPCKLLLPHSPLPPSVREGEIDSRGGGGGSSLSGLPYRLPARLPACLFHRREWGICCIGMIEQHKDGTGEGRREGGRRQPRPPSPSG